MAKMSNDVAKVLCMLIERGEIYPASYLRGVEKTRNEAIEECAKLKVQLETLESKYEQLTGIKDRTGQCKVIQFSASR